MLHEIIYADETSIIGTSELYTEAIEQEASSALKNWNLSVYAQKTEKTILKREEKKEDEDWRTVKELGSLLEDSEKVQRRKQLSAAAFKSLRKIWSQQQNNIRKALSIYIRHSLSRDHCQQGALPPMLDMQTGNYNPRSSLKNAFRMADNIPAKQAMIQFFQPATRFFRGRPRTTLPVVLNQDLKTTKQSSILVELNIQSA